MGFDKSARDRELHRAVLSALGLHEWYPRYPLMHGAPSQCPPGRVAVREIPAPSDGGGQKPGAGRPSA
ncbi:MAG: hypothetical protein ISN29_04830, partial [Gammaproteobacteria bacterium AqS3]|nr:hypothetical protein [Gammaproteobacteria bacterium AqS3]